MVTVKATLCYATKVDSPRGAGHRQGCDGGMTPLSGASGKTRQRIPAREGAKLSIMRMVR
jgi:hypothetical protein